MLYSVIEVGKEFSPPYFPLGQVRLGCEVCHGHIVGNNMEMLEQVNSPALKSKHHSQGFPFCSCVVALFRLELSACVGCHKLSSILI